MVFIEEARTFNKNLRLIKDYERHILMTESSEDDEKRPDRINSWLNCVKRERVSSSKVVGDRWQCNK